MNAKPVAFITGAGQGIGRGIALALAHEGFDIAGNDIRFNRKDTDHGLLEVKARVQELADFLPIKGDISSLKDHKKILSQVLAHYGRIDILVNNAGIAPSRRVDVLETAPRSFNSLFATNARGPFYLTQLVSRHMIAQIGKCPHFKKPMIVFITSISASVSSPNRAEYCISKAALSHIAAIYADRLSEFGINVYEVRPGIIKTAMTASVQQKYDELIAGGLVPQGRWGLPGDVGKAVAALAAGYFSYSTGMVIEVSGGMNIRRL